MMKWACNHPFHIQAACNRGTSRCTIKCFKSVFSFIKDTEITLKIFAYGDYIL